MNFSRSQSISHQSEPQVHNFGSNIHEFMEGLSKIAQILYISIPVIEFVRLSSKYGLRFFEYIGKHLLQLFGIMKIHNRPEDVLEALWKTQSKWKIFTRYSSVVAFKVLAEVF